MGININWDVLSLWNYIHVYMWMLRFPGVVIWITAHTHSGLHKLSRSHSGWCVFYFLCQFRAASVEGMTHWQEAITKGIQMVADEEDGGDMWGLLFWSFLSFESLGWESLFQQGLGGISSLPLAHRHKRKCVHMHAHTHVHTHICAYTLCFLLHFWCVFMGWGGVVICFTTHIWVHISFSIVFLLFLTIIFLSCWVTVSVGVYAIDMYTCVCV